MSTTSTPLHTTETIEDDNYGNTLTRTRLETGWLYTTTRRAFSRDRQYSIAVSTTFVADSEEVKEVVAPVEDEMVDQDVISNDEDLYHAGRGNFKGVIYRSHKTGQYYFWNDDDTWSEGFNTYKECGKAYSAIR